MNENQLHLNTLPLPNDLFFIVLCIKMVKSIEVHISISYILTKEHCKFIPFSLTSNTTAVET